MEVQERLKEGESFIIAREWDKAETAFLKVLGEQPDNVDAFNNLGTLKYLTKQRQKAEEYFLKALGIDSRHKPTLMNLGILYQAEKEWEKAESAFVKYLEFNGDDQNVLNRLKQIRIAPEKDSVTLALTEGINKNKNNVNAPDVDKTAFQNAGVEPSSKGRKAKIAILCSPGLEAFLTDIVRLLDGPYQVRTCYSNNMHELSTAVEWADVVWLEWANELAVHLTNKLPMLAHKKVICRAPTSELFTPSLKQKISVRQDMLEIFERKVEIIIDAHRREVENSTKQIEASIRLQHYLGADVILPDMHNWPISPDFGVLLINLVEQNNYDAVIEFGSGSSTIILSKALKRVAERNNLEAAALLSFDHMEQYADKTRKLLMQSKLQAHVEVRLAPLTPWQNSSGQNFAYYSCRPALDELSQALKPGTPKVLVVVDGPPGATGPKARYPALHVVMDALPPQANIDFLMDDYQRQEEKNIANAWLCDLKKQQRVVSKTECNYSA